MVPGDDLRELRLPSLSVGDALRATFRLYRRHFLTFALVMGMMTVLSLLVVMAVEVTVMASRTPTLGTITRVSTTPGRVIDSVDGILGVLSSGAAVALAANVLRGRSLSVVGAYLWAGTRLRALLVTGGFHSIAMFPATAMHLGLSLPFWLSVMWLPVGIFVVVSLQFMVHAILLERRGIFSSVRRSWRLSHGHRMTILLCLIVVNVIVSLAMIAPDLILGFLNDEEGLSIVLWPEFGSVVLDPWAVFRLISRLLAAPGEILTGALPRAIACCFVK